jgi:glyoxylase-like metal-dependent hydrolase (beta-lactamase superfamily II)
MTGVSTNSIVPVGSMLHAKKKTPVTRCGAVLPGINAVHAPSLQPTNAARASSVPTAIDHDGAAPGRYEGRDLMAPVAAVSQSTMRQHDWRAAAIARVPDTRAIVLHVLLLLRRRQWRRTVRFEARQVVVAGSQHSAVSISQPRKNDLRYTSMSMALIRPHQVTTGVYQLPFPVSNVYIWNWNDGITLIDTGVPESAAGILEAIASLGGSPEGIKEIVLTHFHRDHTGSAAELAQRTGASVLVHPADAAVIAGRRSPPVPDLTDMERVLAQQLFGDLSALPGPQPPPVRVDREVRDGDLTDGGGSIVALPGHTPGSIGLRIPHLGVMFTGDSIAAYDGAPILGPFNVDRAKAIEALRKQAALDFEIACVGHGQPIVGYASRKVLAMIRSF